jgi:hypothetical protein
MSSMTRLPSWRAGSLLMLRGYITLNESDPLCISMLTEGEVLGTYEMEELGSDRCQRYQDAPPQILLMTI